MKKKKGNSRLLLKPFYAFRVLNRKLLSQNNVEYDKPLRCIFLVGAWEGGLASKTYSIKYAVCPTERLPRRRERPFKSTARLGRIFKNRGTVAPSKSRHSMSILIFILAVFS